MSFFLKKKKISLQVMNGITIFGLLLFGLSFVIRFLNNKKENGFSMGLVFISLVLVVIGISL